MSSVLPLSFTVMPFGKYQGIPFDEVPLGYLDWLAGQDWLYGEFKKRLVLYLNKSCIQRELDLLFPDKEVESSDFDPSSSLKDKWHGQPMPKGDNEPWDWQPPKFTRGQAWQLLADWWQAIQDARCIEELPELEGIERLADMLPLQAVGVVRWSYVLKRRRVEMLDLLPPWQRESAWLALEAIAEKPELEAVARREAPELMDAVELVRLS